MFQRGNWWPKIGLTWGRLPEDAKRDCNSAFSGVCDSAVISSATNASNQGAQISYALTLDTHLPIPASSGTGELLKSCMNLTKSDLACEHIENTKKVLCMISETLEGIRKRRDPNVIIVGDHPPPFANSNARATFDNAFVPLFALTPKD